MQPTDLTIEILKSIRDEVRDTKTELAAKLDQTNSRIDGTNQRIVETNTRLDGTNAALDTMREELSRPIVESEIRTSTAITDLAGTVREMTSVLRAQHDLRPRVERCEREIEDLRRRVGG